MADRRDAGARTFPAIAAGVVAGVAALVLLGWLLDSEPLKAVIAGRATMKPNTAIAFVLAAVSLWLQRGSPAHPLERRVALGCATAVAAIGLVTLAEYWFAWDPGIDRWVFPKPPDAVTPFPGRMGINTATSFCLLGAGLLCRRAPVVRLRRTAEVCAAVVAVIALFALVGHLFGVQPLTPLTLGTTQMAVHTAALLLFLCAGLLAVPGGWTVRVLGSEGPGGSAARRLVPTVFAVLLVVSWLRLWGQQAGLFGTEFGVAIVVVTSVVTLTLAVIVNAARLDRGTALQRRAEARFRVVVESAPSGMVMVDRAGTIVLVNREAERLFSYTREEMLNQPIEHLVPERFRRGHPVFRTDFFANPQTRAMGAGRDLFGVRKDGTEIPVEIGLNPIETDEGLFVLASVVDITARKRAETELHRSNEELERFAYVASHDLQEPLRMVGSYVQLLGKRYKGKLDADADEFIGYALDGALRMQRLIEDLLAFSRVGTRGAAFAPTDVGAVVDRALENLKLSIDEAGATVTKNGLPTVSADAGQLEHLFLNLVSNALKFRGAVPPDITIATVRNHLHVAADGVEALTFLRREGKHEAVPKPDLILLDLNLPKKDGREVLDEIKRDDRLRHIPVVILTTSQAERDIAESYRLRANAYVTKPVDLEQFLKVVRSIEHFWLEIVKLSRI